MCCFSSRLYHSGGGVWAVSAWRRGDGSWSCRSLRAHQHCQVRYSINNLLILLHSAFCMVYVYHPLPKCYPHFQSILWISKYNRMVTVLLSCERKLLANQSLFVCRHTVCVEAGVPSTHYLLAGPVHLLHGSQLPWQAALGGCPGVCGGRQPGV